MTFALISEGASEHNIIKYILQAYFKEDEPYINMAYPKIFNNTQTETGGWLEVLKICSNKQKIEEVFNAGNDYLIIQIDTDKAEEKQFGVSYKKNTKLKTDKELLVDVIEKMNSLFDASITENYSDKIFFAICIHSAECWLLPVYFTNNDKTKTTGCLTKLNTVLPKNNIKTLPTTKDKNDFAARKTYEAILKNWKNKKDILAASKHNQGFKFFVDELNKIKV